MITRDLQRFVQRCGRVLALVAVYGLSLAVTDGALASDSHTIRVGMSSALSGPTKFLGHDMRRGIQAYFEHVNRQGGIHGRRLELIALDDGYVPEAAAIQMWRLIRKDHVLAVIGNVGTPTARRSAEIATSERVLFFGPFTGAAFLRQPPNRYVMNVRASYADEVETMIHHLLHDVGIRPFEIGFFTQNDSFGDDGYNAALAALQEAGFPRGADLPHGRYERNTIEVSEAVLTILNAEVQPRAIIMIGAYAPCAKFIRIAKRVLPHTLFLNVSFVGSRALAKALGDQGDHVVMTQVVPPFDADFPLTNDYRQHLKVSFPDIAPSFVSLEGYLVAKVFVEGLKRADTPLTRESIIDGLERLRDLPIGLGPDVRLTYGPGRHKGSNKVWPTMIENGRFVPADWDRLKHMVEH